MRWAFGTMHNHINRALSCVSLPGSNRTGRARWNLEAPLKRDGFYISVGTTKYKFGRSVHTSAYLTHRVQGVLLVWENGQLVGSQVIWKCHARSRVFRLGTSEGEFPCPACLAQEIFPRIRPVPATGRSNESGGVRAVRRGALLGDELRGG